jgi:hypothetical protein
MEQLIRDEIFTGMKVQRLFTMDRVEQSSGRGVKLRRRGEMAERMNNRPHFGEKFSAIICYAESFKRGYLRYSRFLSVLKLAPVSTCENGLVTPGNSVWKSFARKWATAVRFCALISSRKEFHHAESSSFAAVFLS